MKILTIIESMQELAKALNKPCMYISFIDIFDFNFVEELVKAVPYLNVEKHSQIISDGRAILTFNNEDEMNQYYLMTIGDDGPTSLNNYKGIVSVYALTCNSNGELQNENT
jgi:hypothetical protein